MLGYELLGHPAEGGPQVHGVNRRVADEGPDAACDILGRAVVEVVERALGCFASPDAVGIDRPWRRGVGSLHHVPAVGVELVAEMPAHDRPVAFRVVADPTLDAAAHPGDLGGVPGLREPFPVRLGDPAEGRQQVLTEQTGPPGALGSQVPEPDGQPVLDGTRGHPTVGPDPPQLADPPVGGAVPLRRVGAEQLELGYPVAGAEAEVEAAAADDVHHRRLLGDLDRRVQRCDHDAGPDAYPACAGRDGCREGERLREVAVIEQVVFGYPDRVRAQSFRLLAHLQGEPVQAGGVLAAVRWVAEVEVEAYLHAGPLRPDGGQVVKVWSPRL